MSKNQSTLIRIATGFADNIDFFPFIMMYIIWMKYPFLGIRYISTKGYIKRSISCKYFKACNMYVDI
jgi:hypothetical protein